MKEFTESQPNVLLSADSSKANQRRAGGAAFFFLLKDHGDDLGCLFIYLKFFLL